MRTPYYLFLIAIVVLSSCSETNDVVSNKLVQKRKYRAGYSFTRPAKKHDIQKPVSHQSSMSSFVKATENRRLTNTSIPQEIMTAQPRVEPLSTSEQIIDRVRTTIRKKNKLSLKNAARPKVNKPNSDSEKPTIDRKELNRTRIKATLALALMVVGAALVLISFASIFVAYGAPLWLYLLFGFGPLISPLVFALSTMFFVANLNRARRIKKGLEAISVKNRARHIRHKSISPIISVAMIGLMTTLLLLFFAAGSTLAANIFFFGFIAAFLGYFTFGATGLFSQFSDLKGRRKDWLPLIIHIGQLFLFIVFVGFLRIFLRTNYEDNAG